MHSFFTENTDYLLFVAASAAICAVLHWHFWRRKRTGLLAWLVLAVFTFGGWFLVNHADEVERAHLQQIVEGYAPTYARELELLGHERITQATRPDDPDYLRMIDAEKRWLTANHAINDIYTMRRQPNGRFILLVDSETDYNNDGKIEGREVRTPIGRTYPSVFMAMNEAITTGFPRFEKTIYGDAWGEWVSAIVPLRDSHGKVDAILGVDFDAALWLTGIKRARWSTIRYLVLLLAAFTAITVVAAFLVAKRDLRNEKSQQRALLHEKAKLETLVNSIDGIVWECDASTSAFRYVSEQAERILGFKPAEWLSTPEFWRKRLHPGDEWARLECERLVQKNRPYSLQYRLLASDGRSVWIRENAAVMVDEHGQAVLIRGVYRDITSEVLAAEELEKANSALIESSRHAGMAEIATGVLHNVGNVLNSINVSGSLIRERLRHSKQAQLSQIATLLHDHRTAFADFVTLDPRGAFVPELVTRVSAALEDERGEITRELGLIVENIGHVKEIVARQQNYAKQGDMLEPLDTAELVENAVRISVASGTLSGLEVVREFQPSTRMLADKHKTLQILVNLMRNARQAMEATPEKPKQLFLSITGDGDNRVRIGVRDTGIGIAPGNLGKLFAHGFTTKKDGHGFGLHSGALAAREMGGALTVSSEGVGLGAHFTLEMPAFREAAHANFT
jgi:PAS domain S-box-containing protein